jgi:flagellar basal-body rod modification protein FlgD
MQTNPTTSNSNAAGQAGTDPVTPSSAPSDPNRDMFTQLLVAQIRNQDPLSPSDPTQFVNQLSQLSQTEALQNLTKTTTASASVLQSLQVLAMGAQVGSSVSVSTPTVSLSDQPLTGSVTLTSPSASTSVVLTGADGVAHPVTLPAHGIGAQRFTIDPAALGLAPGTYTLQAQAADGTQPQVEINGRIDSVRMSAGGGVVLLVSNVGEIDPSSITGFNGKAAASSTVN